MEDANLLTEVVVTVAVCDRSQYGSSMVSQFGLSLLVDCSWENGSATRILFDTGWDGEVLLRNLADLRVPVDSIDKVVLSHAHYDHTGGLEGLIRSDGARFQLIAHPDITRRVFSGGSELKFIGLDPETLSLLPSRHLVLIREAVEIAPFVWTTGTIPRWSEFEEPEEDVYVLTDEGRLVPDPELDDMALVLRVGGDRLVVLTGCSHAGIVNTIERATEVGGSNRIGGVVGGFHLLDKELEVQRKTVETLNEFNMESVCSGHCTGWRAEDMFQEVFGEAFSRLYTGDRFVFRGTKDE